MCAEFFPQVAVPVGKKSSLTANRRNRKRLSLVNKGLRQVATLSEL